VTTEIHDQSYRRYAGTREPRGGAWTVIASAGVRSLIRKRAFFGLLLFAWLPFVVRAVQIYIAANFPQTSPLLGLNAQTFRQFLDQQGTFVFFVTIYVGAGLIANDRRTNALQIYLSKPLTRAEYIAGKLAILVTFLGLVTWVPAILLLVLQIVFQGSFAFARQNLFLFPAITLFSMIQVLLASTTMLALSSLSTSSRYAGILYAGAVLFTDAMFNALRVITGGTMISWISFPANLAQIGDLIFRLPPRYETPWPVSLVAIVGLMVVSLSVLEGRVRGVEVVK
jgi:ABC-2 type transport system permease protein